MLLPALLTYLNSFLSDRKGLVFYGAGLVLSLGLTVIFRGLSWLLFLFPLGYLAGIPILDLDRFLAPKLELSENFFHRFPIFLLTFCLAVFVITASGSLFGRGMVVAILVHGWQAIEGVGNRRIGFLLLGVVLLLLVL